MDIPDYKVSAACARQGKPSIGRSRAFDRNGQASGSFVALLSIILLFTMMFVSPVIAQEKITKVADSASETVWLIKQPDVRKAHQDYPMITFKKYDEVVITGGGCVQTGGKGRTWKRYIDPTGPNSDRLYHGRIWIPGATAGLVRISSIVKKQSQYQVVNMFPDHSASEAPSPYFLRLGYEDEKYTDNGYEKHDDGTDKQCAASEDPETDGKAWLQLRIKHHDDLGSAPKTADPQAPFDLWWNKVDDNFLPLNPDWWIHHNEGSFPNSNRNDDHQACDQFREGKGDGLLRGKHPQCTTWDPDIDEANLLSSFCHLARPFSNSVHGHINWSAATYNGDIYFDVSNNLRIDPGTKEPQEDALTGKIGDGDYDWLLVTKGDIGSAEGNKASSIAAIKGKKLPEGVNAMALEFSSRETVDRINDSSWWREFHRQVDHNPGGAIDMVKGREAIVIGLIGFDNEHGDRAEGARVELHPVYGLAIHTKDTKKDLSLSEDVWVILARNWGNEGSCSNGFDVTHGKWQHYLGLPENKMKFFLPATMGPSTIVTATFNSTNGEASGKVTTQSQNDGVLLTIQLPEPESMKLFWGELHIKK